MARGLSQDTASFAFDGSNEIAATEQVAKLSETEMKETKGELLGRAVVGGGLGAIGYTGYTLASGNDFSSSSLGSWSTFGAGMPLAGPAYVSVRSVAQGIGRHAKAAFGWGYITGSIWD
jgi:hypothetical protein